MDTGFILNRRPFRDNSLLVDLLTKESGRITCIARVAKKRGKIMAGTLEPFRQLRIDWIGKGEVQTLTMAEEQGMYRVPVRELCKALYLNELILKLVPKHAPAEDVFHSYQQAIQQIAAQTTNLVNCEMNILETLGYSFRHPTDLQSITALQEQLSYRYSTETGLACEISPTHSTSFQQPFFAEQGVPISGKLLIKLNKRSTLDVQEQQELRHFLNQLIDVLLAGKKLNSRKLAFGHSFEQ